MPGDVTLIAP